MELRSKKILNVAAIKTMGAAADAEAKKYNGEVTLCVVDGADGLVKQ